jgi:mono/diheme cytochrome c family protein
MKWLFGRSVVWVAITIATAAMAFAVQNNDLPEGEGKSILQSSCTSCHGLAALDKFKGSYKAKDWSDLVNNMKAYGATITDTQVTTLVDYLAKNFGPKDGGSSAASSDDAAGKAILESGCTSCHGLDAIERLNLNKDSWTDVVRNMIGNGANVTDQQVPVLVDYLVKKYGPKK